jgi:polyhydroxyalkanoate synthase
MFVVWLVFAALTGLAALALAWWSLLSALYPERLRATEVHTVSTPDLWNLRLCRYRRGRAPGEPVLLVHGANANHHNFTSPEGACLIDHLVGKGYDCWAVDLRGCRSATPPFEHSPDEPDMDDFLLKDLPAVLAHIHKRTGYDQVHWIGHSMGGMLLYAYAQHFGTAQIASGTTLGAPIGFDGVRMRKPVELVFILRWFRPLVGAVLRSVIPFALLAGRGFSLFPVNLRNRPKGMGVGHFFNMIEDPLPRVLTELGFQINRKIWRMNQDQLDVKAGLATMPLPLMAVCGVRDPFTPLPEVRAFIDRLPTDDKQLLVCGREFGHKHDYDHCDLAFGEEGAREVFEPVSRWLAAHPIRPRALAEGEEPAITLLRPEERDRILGTPPRVETPEVAAPPPPAANEEIVAVPVDLEHTASSALAALEKKLGKALASGEKPTRSDRIRRAASTLDAVAGSLGAGPGDTPRIPLGVEVPKAKAKVKAKPKPKAQPTPKTPAAKPAKTATDMAATAKAKTKAATTAKSKAAAKPAPARAKATAPAGEAKPAAAAKPAAKKAAAKKPVAKKAAVAKAPAKPKAAPKKPAAKKAAPAKPATKAVQTKKKPSK